MRSTLKWNELSDHGFTKDHLWGQSTRASQYYRVRKPSTVVDWPEDKELISFCDGAEGMNFGGTVRLGGDTANVVVYVD